MILFSSFNYEFSHEQQEKYKEWRNSLPAINTGAIGGRFTIEFTPTHIGVFVKVRAEHGHELDLTEYDKM